MSNYSSKNVKCGRPVNCEITDKECGYDVERMIRKFSKKVRKMGIIEKYLEKAYHVKPSQKRRMKRKNKARMAYLENKRNQSLNKNEK